MKITDGVFKPLMAEFKKAAGTGDQIAGTEMKKILKKGLAAIREEFDGADSEKGLAAQRNALAKTFKAADRNWNISKTGYAEAKKILGSKLDGKGGEMAALEKALRNEIRADTYSSYGGGSSSSSSSVS